jgi:acyl-CoA synthetase (AMP-forming)/AMP-acid ligase II
MQGYLNKPAETRETLADGTLYTGDLGVVDADGFVHVTGRVKDLIIVSGENVLPIEIERVLVEHPQVAEAAVVGVADGTRGEKPIAFITARGGAAPAATELREFCRARLAGYKVPRDVFVVETLPRGPTGKVLKRALRPPAAARPA